jgi:drug/metabolite transporter (DMT)-like permease
LTEIHILFVFLQQKREDLAEMAQISGIQKAFIQLHLSVMLAGFTGLFGKLITLNEVDIVWYRMLFTSIILLVFTGLPQVERKKLLQLGGCGALLGLHWMLFYGSIKASNVSIGVICYSLVGFFTAIIEPIIYRKKISTIEILFSLITVLGLLCIFSFDARYRYGISIGVLSSFVAALYGVCNKKVSVGVKTRTVLFYQMSAGLVVVSMIIPFYLMMFPAHQDVLVIPEGSNLWWMLCHALFCTVAMYILQIQALRTLSAFTVNLTYNLEPCYTIAIAFIVFHEARELNFSFYIGIALILISVILQTWRATLSKK